MPYNRRHDIQHFVSTKSHTTINDIKFTPSNNYVSERPEVEKGNVY